jgi:hypothetical protein
MPTRKEEWGFTRGVELSWELKFGDSSFTNEPEEVGKEFGGFPIGE